MTIPTDHFLTAHTNDKTCHIPKRPQRQQREQNWSSKKRGFRSEAARLQRQYNRQQKRNEQRRIYRGCKSNMLCGAGDNGGGGLGACLPGLTRKTETFPPLKDARLALHTRASTRSTATSTKPVEHKYH